MKLQQLAEEKSRCTDCIHPACSQRRTSDRGRPAVLLQGSY